MARPWRLGKRERLCTAQAAPPASDVQSTTDPKRSKRPPSSLRPPAATESQSRSIISRDQVDALVQRIDAERGRLDVLVNDIWGAELLFEWNAPVWEHDLEKGLRILRLRSIHT